MSDDNGNNNDGGDGGAGDGGANGDGGGIGDAGIVGFDSLDSEIRENLARDYIKDLPGLVKVFQDQKSHLGNSIRVPGDDASDADKQAFYTKLQEKVPNLIPKPDKEDKEAWDALHVMLGRPGEVGDYKMPEMENLDTTRMEGFRNKAFELGLTQSQFEAIVQSEYDVNTQTNEDSKTAHEADLKALSNDWGLTYDKRLTDIRNFADRTGAPKDLLEMLDNKQIGAEALKWFHTLAKNVSGGGSEVRSQAPGGTDDVPPAEALARAREIMTKLGDMKPSDPQYRALHDKRDRFMEMAYPEAAKGIEGLRANKS